MRLSPSSSSSRQLILSFVASSSADEIQKITQGVDAVGTLFHSNLPTNATRRSLAHTTSIVTVWCGSMHLYASLQALSVEFHLCLRMLGSFEPSVMPYERRSSQPSPVYASARL